MPEHPIKQLEMQRQSSQCQNARLRRLQCSETALKLTFAKTDVSLRASVNSADKESLCG